MYLKHKSLEQHQGELINVIIQIENINRLNFRQIQQIYQYKLKTQIAWILGILYYKTKSQFPKVQGEIDNEKETLINQKIFVFLFFFQRLSAKEMQKEQITQQRGTQDVPITDSQIRREQSKNQTFLSKYKNHSYEQMQHENQKSFKGKNQNSQQQQQQQQQQYIDQNKIIEEIQHDSKLNEIVETSNSNENDRFFLRYIFNQNQCKICEEHVEDKQQHLFTDTHLKKQNKLFHKQEMEVEQYKKMVTNLIPGMKLWNKEQFEQEFESTNTSAPNYKQYIIQQLQTHSDDFNKFSKKTQENISSEAAKIIYYAHKNQIETLSLEAIKGYIDSRVLVFKIVQPHAIRFILQLLKVNSKDISDLLKQYENQFDQIKNTQVQKYAPKDYNSYQTQSEKFMKMLTIWQEYEVLFYFLLQKNLNKAKKQILRLAINEFQVINDILYYTQPTEEKRIHLGTQQEAIISFIKRKIQDCTFDNNRTQIFQQFKTDNEAKQHINTVIKKNLYYQTNDKEFFDFMQDFDYVVFKKFIRSKKNYEENKNTITQQEQDNEDKRVADITTSQAKQNDNNQQVIQDLATQLDKVNVSQQKIQEKKDYKQNSDEQKNQISIEKQDIDSNRIQGQHEEKEIFVDNFINTSNNIFSQSQQASGQKNSFQQINEIEASEEKNQFNQFQEEQQKSSGIKKNKRTKNQIKPQSRRKSRAKSYGNKQGITQVQKIKDQETSQEKTQGKSKEQKQGKVKDNGKDQKVQKKSLKQKNQKSESEEEEDSDENYQPTKLQKKKK
ncbi:unnamed protein product [Paramecium primaurelia]|uniref:Uncharacterized protein n=1 Tax=Paramecium primaurelia TaxID=5886 RepID=A0A8S1PQF2_PARPR|nr:unnamed protein product [Paramecium primaurelia]